MLFRLIQVGQVRGPLGAEVKTQARLLCRLCHLEGIIHFGLCGHFDQLVGAGLGYGLRLERIEKVVVVGVEVEI